MESVGTPEWTWVLHGSLLIVAIYGRFAKIWSVRNLDLLLLVGLTPALFVYNDHPWILFALSALLAVRLIFDCRFVRRPRVDPNLNSYGLSFLCVAAFSVLMVRVFIETPGEGNLSTVMDHADAMLQREVQDESSQDPTTTIVASQALVLADKLAPSKGETRQVALQVLAVVAHTFVVSGLLVVGWRHFGSFNLGLAMATLYLLLPCTAFYVHQVSHVLPAAFLIWAFASYRKPVVSGSLLAFATGALFSTFFLLPLWAAFYGRKRLLRFGSGLLITAAVLSLPLFLTSLPGSEIVAKLNRSMNWSVLNILDPEEYRASEGLDLVRPHLMIVFFCVFVTLTIWPRKKELGHLIAHSTVLVVLAQLWYPETQAIYVLWYLPVLLVVVFRPRLRHLREEEDPLEAPRLAREPDVRSRTTVAPSLLSR